jgi:hypothetical protein
MRQLRSEYTREGKEHSGIHGKDSTVALHLFTIGDACSTSAGLSPRLIARMLSGPGETTTRMTAAR